MARQLLVNQPQLERIVRALKLYDMDFPLTGEQREDDNLRHLTGALEDTLLQPDNEDTLHGICL